MTIAARSTLLLAALFAVLATSAVAATMLDAVASDAAWKPVAVTCRTDLVGYTGAAFVGGETIEVSSVVCREASQGLGIATMILLHEAAHTRGIADEAEATCSAMIGLRDAMRSLGLPARQARYEYWRAWQFQAHGMALGYRCVGLSQPEAA